MFRAIVFSMVAASLSGCVSPTSQQQVDQATTAQAAPAPTAEVQPQPEVVYVPQPVYVYLPQPVYDQSQAQATWGAAGYQPVCGLAGDCGRSTLSRDVDVNLNTNNCTSHVFGGAIPTIQTSCY